MVLIFVTSSAERNQIQFVIGALLAAQLLVVDLQAFSGTTDLASPAITTQDLLSEPFVGFGIKPQARSLGSNPLHDALAVTSWRKACRCSPGRNLKNRDMDCKRAVGSSFFEVCSCQEVRAYHLQAVASALVRSQHQSCRLNCLLDHRNLGLVQLEVDNLRWFRFPPSQFLLHRLVDKGLGHPPGSIALAQRTKHSVVR